MNEKHPEEAVQATAESIETKAAIVSEWLQAVVVAVEPKRADDCDTVEEIAEQGLEVVALVFGFGFRLGQLRAEQFEAQQRANALGAM